MGANTYLFRRHSDDAIVPAPRPDNIILSVRRLGITVGLRPILRDVSFELAANASLAIIGPNGSGKTLLLKALLGIFPHSGTIRWQAGVRIGYVPQSASADPHLPLRVRELFVAKARVQHLTPDDVDVAVQRVGVSELLDQQLGVLSSGQLQKVLIGFALIGNPQALLIDEPTSSLDEPTEQHISQLISNIRRELGTTIITVSHDLTLLRGLATHVLCLSGGGARFGTAEKMLVPEILQAVYGGPVAFHSHMLESRREPG